MRRYASLTSGDIIWCPIGKKSPYLGRRRRACAMMGCCAGSVVRLVGLRVAMGESRAIKVGGVDQVWVED